MPVLTLGEKGLQWCQPQTPQGTGGQMTRCCLLTCSCLLILGLFFVVKIEHRAWPATDIFSPFISYVFRMILLSPQASLEPQPLERLRLQKCSTRPGPLVGF